jgi:hypothetical protein
MVADTVVIGVVEVDTRVTSTLPRDEEPSASPRQPTFAASGLWILPDLRCATLRRHRFYAKTKRARWMELLTRVSCWQRRSERSSAPHARCLRAPVEVGSTTALQQPGIFVRCLAGGTAQGPKEAPRGGRHVASFTRGLAFVALLQGQVLPPDGSEVVPESAVVDDILG